MSGYNVRKFDDCFSDVLSGFVIRIARNIAYSVLIRHAFGDVAPGYLYWCEGCSDQVNSRRLGWGYRRRRTGKGQVALGRG